MTCFKNSHGMVGTVEEIRVSERDVFGSHRDQLGNVLKHDVDTYDSKQAVVDRRNRTVSAAMPTPVTRLNISHGALSAIHLETGIARQWRKDVPGW